MKARHTLLILCVFATGCASFAERRTTDQILAQLKAIMIPEIDFKDTQLVTAVDFLNKSIAGAGTTDRSAKDLTIRIDDDVKKGWIYRNSFSKSGTGPLHTITFRGRDVSALQALSIITTIVGVKFCIIDDEIRIVPCGGP